MQLLVFFGLIIAVVWGLVALRHRQSLTRGMYLFPVLGFLVILTGSVFSSDFFSIRGPLPITIDRLLLGATVGLFCLLVLARQETVFLFNRVDISVLFLIGVLSLSTVTHDFTFMDNLPLSRLLFYYWLPVALYFVMRNCRFSDANLRFIAGGMAVLGLYLAVTAIFETRGLESLVFPRYIMSAEIAEFLGRGRGPFLNPVSNGVFQIVGLSCLWMWWPSASLRGRGVILGIALTMCIGVYSTLTRSVWMGLVVAAGITVFLPTSRQAKGAMIVAAVLVAVILLPVIGDKLISFKRDKNVTLAEMQQSAGLRPLFFTVAARMTADRPLLGCGFGQYAIEKYPYLQDPTSNQPLAKTKTYFQHNVFLAYVSETGVIGLGALLVMLAMFARVAILNWIDPTLPFWRQQFGMVLLVFLSSHCINGMFHDTSIIPMENTLMFFLAAISNNVYSRHHQALELHGLRQALLNHGDSPAPAQTQSEPGLVLRRRTHSHSSP